ncbi:hypothetical protein COW36_01690 [bacterium (Candidatus Blackallbacteria) CG17_big_fil_post_rev_8_21_14_2_50_48_46]|uniref:Uncharacterized protein n=1 Tax=bacterium (Candidatus Blackallbacteria) CG17_big_fil_post_rev_8_21_14_2_50_48_46 TaxID=2014261 RepID=A0A2M7GAI1_9BACT|nr:MAG: hypothetical protein COW36_01690 [bacterium (Candidatus Blackallbacteria) CG17_big_fil_post_rev_8_21_14_2_50_48_46]
MDSWLRLSLRWGGYNFVVIIFFLPYLWWLKATFELLCKMPDNYYRLFPLANLGLFLVFSLLEYYALSRTLKLKEIKHRYVLLYLTFGGNLAGFLAIAANFLESPFILLYLMTMFAVLLFKYLYSEHWLNSYSQQNDLPKGFLPFSFPWNWLWVFLGYVLILWFSLPNLIGADCRSPISTVKANMHTVQTMLETYGVDWGGTYPLHFSLLKQEAQTVRNPYWKAFVNPFNMQGFTRAYQDFDAEIGLPRKPKPISFLGVAYFYPALNAPRYQPGSVLLSASNCAGNSCLQYFIYGTDAEGYILEDRQVPFVLSNS